jgi:hypothetical protein
MENLYLEIVQALEKKERVVLATLIHRVGSAPRAAGAQYLVKEDGTSFGSIGAGALKQRSGRRQRGDGERGRGVSLPADHEQLAEGRLICEISIFFGASGPEFLDIYREFEDQTEKGSAILATLIALDHSSVRARTEDLAETFRRKWGPAS